jgi:hypothetical protein
VNEAGRSVWGDRLFLSSIFYQNYTSEMLRTMVLHGEPPAWSLGQIPGPLKQIVDDGRRLRARLPEYLEQRRIFIDSNCLRLLPPLLDIVSGYSQMTTDEIWDIGLHK